MYFSYYEKGWGELCFYATISPFKILLSEKIPEMFFVGLS
jgi:hypothetical protein